MQPRAGCLSRLPARPPAHPPARPPARLPDSPRLDSAVGHGGVIEEDQLAHEGAGVLELLHLLEEPDQAAPRMQLRGLEGAAGRPEV